MKYKTKAIIYITLFALFICDVSAQQIEGFWGTNNSNYYLSITDSSNTYNFQSYKFMPYENENGDLAWRRQLAPGKEVFVKKEGNKIITRYWIVKDDYYVKVTYTLITPTDLKAEFKGKLNDENYYNVLNYKKVYIEKSK